MKSAQTVNIEEKPNMHLKKDTTSEISFDVLDIGHSCSDPPTQSKLA